MRHINFITGVLLIGIYLFVSPVVVAQPTRTPELELPKGYSIISADEIIRQAKSRKGEYTKIVDTHQTGRLGVGVIFESPLLMLPEFRRLVKKGYLSAEWETKSYDKRNSSLYLLNIHSIKISQKRLDNFKAKLSAKFGTDTMGSVKASWVTGKIRFLYSPLETIFGYVSPEERFVSYKNGILNKELIREHNTRHESDYTPLYRGSMQWCQVAEPGELIMKSMDGLWYIHDGYGFDCLEQWLNDRYRPPIDTLAGMLWLLTTDKRGQSHLTDLTPGAIAIRQKQQSQEVVRLIEQLPRMSFGFLITEDRKLYSGRFIEASYSKSEGWRLTETLTPKL